MNVQFLKTKTISDTEYVDLVNIDGKLFTFIMKKISEPNIFDVKTQLDGDHFEGIA